MSTTLKFCVQGQRITRADAIVTVADAINYIYAEFAFCSDWDGLVKTAVFTRGASSYEQILEDDKCLVPYEILEDGPGIFKVSVFAGNLITTAPVKVRIDASGWSFALESSQPPTPGIYQQILERMAGIETEMETATAAAEASAVLAESYAKGGTSTRQGEDTDNARYYSEQASGSAEEAAQIVQDFDDDVVAGAIAAVEAAGTEQIGAVNTAGATQVGAVESAGSTQTTAVNNAGSTQVGLVQAKGTEQVAAVQAKGTEVIGSIPSDYTALTSDVGDLKSAFNDTLTINHEIITEYNYYTDGIIKDDGHYINSDGSFGSNADYTYIAMRMDTDCYVYATVDTTWHEMAIYSDTPFGVATVVNVYVSSTPLPTYENPLYVSAGQYVVLVKKQPTTRGYSIFKIGSELYSINEQTMIPVTNERLDNLESNVSELDDKIGNVDTHAQMQGILYRKTLPDYYFAMPEIPTSFSDNEYMLSRLAHVPDGKHFIFVTDTHWDGTYNGKSNNCKHSNYMINFVRNRLGNIPVVFGGDVINANPTKYQAALVARQYINECVDAYGDKFIGVLGNHDTNVIGQTGDTDTYEIPYSVLKPIFTDNIIEKAVFRDEMESILTKTSDPDLIEQYDAYFKLNYVVNTNNGITFIVINTGAHGSFVRENFGIHGVDEIYLHQKWLYNVLMNIPEGNDVVLCGHELTYGIGNPLSTWNLRSAILQLCGIAAKRQIELYTQSEAISEKTAPWVPSSQYPTYNFAEAPNTGKVFAIGGHWHHDFAVKIGYNGNNVAVSACNDGGNFSKASGEIPVIQTICDAIGQYRNESGDGYTTDPADFTMEYDTVTEQAFDVVTITDDGIVTTRFGAAEKPSYMQRVFLQS